MKNIKVNLLLMSAAVLLLVSGCGGALPKESQEKPEVSQEVSQEASPEPEGKETPEAEAQAPSAEETSEPAASEASAERKDGLPESFGAYVPELIEQNGSQFVRLDDKVYFRRQNQKSIAQIALWGEFLEQPDLPAEGVSSMICAYDLKSGEVEELFADQGYGPLFFADGGFYCTRYTEEGDVCYWISLDGREQKELGRGSVLGVREYEESACVAVKAYLPEETIILYADLEEYFHFSAGEMESIQYCGMDHGFLYFLWQNYTDVTCSLAQLPVGGGEVVELGQIPKPEYTGSNPELEDFLWDVEALSTSEEELEGEELDRIYLLLGYYEGTGHFLADAQLIKAVPNLQGSVELLEYTASAPDAEKPGFLYMEKPGEIKVVQHLPGDIELSDATSGDLILYDTPDHSVTVVKDFIKSQGYGAENAGDISTFAQKMELIGDKVFVVTAEGAYAPEEDIGWRVAYRLESLHYLVMDKEGGSPQEL